MPIDEWMGLRSLVHLQAKLDQVNEVHLVQFSLQVHTSDLSDDMLPTNYKQKHFACINLKPDSNCRNCW